MTTAQKVNKIKSYLIQQLTLLSGFFPPTSVAAAYLGSQAAAAASLGGKIPQPPSHLAAMYAGIPGLGSPALGAPGLGPPGLGAPSLGAPGVGLGPGSLGPPGMGVPGLGSASLGAPPLGPPGLGPSGLSHQPSSQP